MDKKETKKDKKYTSLDEFINDDGTDDQEKTEIAEAVFEAEKGE